MSKLFDKNFIIGFYLPALLAIIATAWVFPNFTVLDPVRSLTASEKTLGDLTYVALIAWVLAILLMTANHMQYRLLEGYLPPVSWLRPLLQWHRFRFRLLKREFDTLMSKWERVDLAPQEQERATRIGRWLATYYPSTEAEVMRTRFGNNIRSFEVYPRDAYGADSVPVWLRLASVIPKDFAGLIEDARAQVDCFVNIADLAFLLMLASLAGAAYDADLQHFPILGAAGLRYVEIAVTGLVVATIAYFSAAARAIAWGDLVRSAFDCYLPSLIKQLGFAVPPTDAERREFWSEFSALIVYKRPMTANRWPLASEAAAKQGPEKPQAKPEPPDEAESELTVAGVVVLDMEQETGPSLYSPRDESGLEPGNYDHASGTHLTDGS